MSIKSKKKFLPGPKSCFQWRCSGNSKWFRWNCNFVRLPWSFSIDSIEKFVVETSAQKQSHMHQLQTRLKSFQWQYTRNDWFILSLKRRKENKNRKCCDAWWILLKIPNPCNERSNNDTSSSNSKLIDGTSEMDERWLNTASTKYLINLENVHCFFV